MGEPSRTGLQGSRSAWGSIHLRAFGPVWERGPKSGQTRPRIASTIVGQRLPAIAAKRCAAIAGPVGRSTASTSTSARNVTRLTRPRTPRNDAPSPSLLAPAGQSSGRRDAIEEQAAARAVAYLASYFDEGQRKGDRRYLERAREALEEALGGPTSVPTTPRDNPAHHGRMETLRTIRSAARARRGTDPSSVG